MINFRPHHQLPCYSQGHIPRLFSDSSVIRMLFVVLLLLGYLSEKNAGGVVSATKFNFEVGQRVQERLEKYMGDPSTIVKIISEYRKNSGFKHDMRAPDRNAYLRLSDAMMALFPYFESIYFGLDDGVFMGHGFASGTANYREPGESGYALDDTIMAKKYLKRCLDETGTVTPCIMKPDYKYTQCIDDCELDLCPDEDSQRDCSIIDEVKNATERMECESKIKWCKKYVIASTPSEEDAEEEENNALKNKKKKQQLLGQHGFVPRGTYCINTDGIPSQTPGTIRKKGTSVLGNCVYKDGVTPVDGLWSGEYAYCGDDEKATCNNTFVGMYISRDYDPRWRGWYIGTRAMQIPNWSPPYPFFTTLQMGITYSQPIYSMQDDGKNVFAGVVAVDYTFTNITEFLVENYLNTTTTVVIFEDQDPHYIIAASTGRMGAKQVLKKDPTLPCSDLNRTAGECKAIRITITDTSDIDPSSMDAVLANAFEMQKQAGYPEAELIATKAPDNTVYVSQTQIFQLPDAGLSWRVMIMSPAELSAADTILKGQALFGLSIAIGSLGIVICITLLYLYFRRRNKRAIVVSDWRFTSVFILCCAMMNASTFSFIGPNTNTLCMLRMWLLHIFFATVMSPLLVKIYRIFKLIGASSQLQRTQISNTQTAMMTAPIIIVQVIILIIFSIIDPNKQTRIILMEGSEVTHRLICSHDTMSFFIVELIFEGGLILLGCILAFKSRNLNSEFGEAKQLVICMYDIALVGSILLIVTNAVQIDQGAKRILYSLGIFWATTFASCVFVIPRLLRARRNSFQKKQKAGMYSSQFSGMPNSSMMNNSGIRKSGISGISGVSGVSGASMHVIEEGEEDDNNDGAEEKYNYDEELPSSNTK